MNTNIILNEPCAQKEYENDANVESTLLKRIQRASSSSDESSKKKLKMNDSSSSHNRFSILEDTIQEVFDESQLNEFTNIVNRRNENSRNSIPKNSKKNEGAFHSDWWDI